MGSATVAFPASFATGTAGNRATRELITTQFAPNTAAKQFLAPRILCTMDHVNLKGEGERPATDTVRRLEKANII